MQYSTLYTNHCFIDTISSANDVSDSRDAPSYVVDARFLCSLCDGMPYAQAIRWDVVDIEQVIRWYS